MTVYDETLARIYGMTGTCVVSEETLEGLRLLLGVAEGKEGGDGVVWRVRAYVAFPRARDPTRTKVACVPPLLYYLHQDVC